MSESESENEKNEKKYIKQISSILNHVKQITSGFEHKHKYHCYWKLDVFEEWFPIINGYPNTRIVEDPICDCSCGKLDHAHKHFIIDTDMNIDTLRVRRHRDQKKKNLPGFGKSKLKQLKSLHHEFGAVLYIIGKDSVNYTNGFARTKKDAHVNHQGFHKGITNGDKRAVLEELRDEFPTMRREFNEWKIKNEAQRKKSKERRLAKLLFIQGGV